MRVPGVNLNIHNQATLHTTPNCTMPPDYYREPQTGCGLTFLLHTRLGSDNRCRQTATTNCDAAVDFNAGCGVIFSDPKPSCTSFGAPFNQAGGGYFVMYRESDSVKIWFFPRDGPVPDVICKGAQWGQAVYPDFTWGAPAANFPFYPEYCDYDQHFNAHEMVFDLTFCVGVLVGTFVLFHS